MSDATFEPDVFVLEPCAGGECAGSCPGGLVEAIPLEDFATDEADEARARRWRHQRHRQMLWISCVVVGLSFLLQVRPGGLVAFRAFESYPLPQSCLSRSLFGIDCPGCGLTRSFVYLAHGQWSESMAIHRLGWLMAVSVLLQLPYRILGMRHPEGLPLGRRIPVWYGRMLIFLLIANWVVLLFE